MRFLKGFLKWTGIAFLGLVVIGLIADAGKDKSKPASLATPVTQSSTKPPASPVRMSATAVEEAVEENEINLQNRVTSAGGLLVTGRVKSVEAVWGKPVVHLRGRNQFIDVSAFLASGDKERAATLRKGDGVTVLCQTAKKVIGAALYDCRFN